MSDPGQVIVTGDVLRDTNIAVAHADDSRDDLQNIESTAGGALLLQQLLHELLHDPATNMVRGVYQAATNRQSYRMVELSREWFNGRTYENVDSRTRFIDHCQESLAVHAQSYFRFEQTPITSGDLDDDALAQRLLQVRRARIDSWRNRERAKLEHPNITDDEKKRLQNIERARQRILRSSWRVSQILGSGRQIANDPVAPPVEDFTMDPVETADTTVVFDGGFGFAQEVGRGGVGLETIRKLLAARHQLVYKVRYRDALHDEMLFRTVMGQDLPKLIFLQIDDLRTAGLLVSRRLSWERTCTDVLAATTGGFEGGTARALSIMCQDPRSTIVVTFRQAGALLREAGHSGWTLIYDPLEQEGDWQALCRNTTYGNQSTMVACALLGLKRAAAPKGPPTGETATSLGIKLGLTACRYLQLAGFSDDRPEDKLRTRLLFPFEQIGTLCQAYRHERDLSGTTGPPAAEPDHSLAEEARWVREFEEGTWRRAPCVLEARGPIHPSWSFLVQQPEPLVDVSLQVAKTGPSCLRGIPRMRFRKLEVIDREEIEGFNSIRAVVENYLAGDDPVPLSFAVFGQPGSGKTYGISKMAEVMDTGKRRLDPVTFNLSQFGSYADLCDALHVVRDKAFERKVPMVFWDEFDSTLNGERLGWLRSFLAPMQDGAFREGQIVHPIGRAVFVFVGGTKSTFHEFAAYDHEEEARAAKVPDFVSRLRGHVDILGPNRSSRARQHGNNAHYIRRAVFLHQWLTVRHGSRLKEGEKLRIRDSVLNAFLFTDQYQHGFRSMVALLSMCRLEGAETFGPSELPAEEQMHGHVNVTEFMSFVYGERSRPAHS